MTRGITTQSNHLNGASEVRSHPLYDALYDAKFQRRTDCVIPHPEGVGGMTTGSAGPKLGLNMASIATTRQINGGNQRVFPDRRRNASYRSASRVMTQYDANWRRPASPPATSGAANGGIPGFSILLPPTPIHGSRLRVLRDMTHFMTHFMTHMTHRRGGLRREPWRRAIQPPVRVIRWPGLQPFSGGTRCLDGRGCR